jgi:predicted metal-dependent phosphoesterase TrpH
MRLRINSINLHIHTSCSDGAFKPREVINKSQQKCIDIISITDHDTIEAYKHIPQSGFPTRILPGIELSSSWEEQDIHILGYGIDYKNKPLIEILGWMKEGRHTRAERMIDKLEKLGLKIPFELVLSFTGEMNLIVRPHIAQALVAKKYCKNKQEAFEKYIGNDAPAYVPKPILSTPEAIEFIHNAGGIAVIAHPGKLKSMNFLNDLITLKIDGLEVCHPDHQDYLIKELSEFCVKNCLYQTGGSDFHGEPGGLTYLDKTLVPEAVIKDVQTIWDKYKCRMK